MVRAWTGNCRTLRILHNITQLENSDEMYLEDALLINFQILLHSTFDANAHLKKSEMDAPKKRKKLTCRMNILSK